MNTTDAKRILETALICSQQPVPVRDLRVLFEDALSADSIKALLAELQQDWGQRGLELVCVASGWRFQSRPEMRAFLDRLHPEKPPKYTRATLETLVAFRDAAGQGTLAFQGGSGSANPTPHTPVQAPAAPNPAANRPAKP